MLLELLQWTPTIMSLVTHTPPLSGTTITLGDSTILPDVLNTALVGNTFNASWEPIKQNIITR